MSHAMTFGETASGDDKLWALCAHLSVYIFPFFGSLLLYLVHKDKPFVAYHAAQSFALQVAIWAAGIVVAMIAGVTCGVGAILGAPLALAYFLPLWGAFVAYNGEWQGYPMLSQLGR